MTIQNAPFLHFSFDVWLTLIRSHPDFKLKRNILFKEFFSINGHIEKVTQVLRHYDVLANSTSEVTGKHFDGSQIYCLALSELQVSMDKLTTVALNEFQAAADHLFMQYKPVLIDHNISDCFKAIKARGKTISILSNTAFIKGTILREVLDHYSLSEYLSFQLYSDETGYSKPCQEAFDLVFRKASALRTLNKLDVVHIGDNPKADYQGALDYGFNAMLI
jgi:putative hydrolase of the HAD superfamily